MENPSANSSSAKRTYTRYPFSVRERVVELYESGFGCKRIARLTGLDGSMIRHWLRRYRADGLDSLRLIREPASEKELGVREKERAEKDAVFQEAFRIYSTTLEPTASIARRFHLDYRVFKYHVEKHHPELVSERKRLMDAPR